MYQLTQNGVLRLEDNVWIPNDVRNRDWQDYQEWLKEGNTPEPAPVELSAVAIANGNARQARHEQQRLTDFNSRMTTLEQDVRNLKTGA